MRFVTAAQIAQAAPFPALIDALERAFAADPPACVAPPRAHRAVTVAGEPARTLLTMAAWGADGGAVVKLVNVVPANGAKGLPAVQAVALVSDPATGAWVAALDGAALTARRTAAASALAARHLARADARALCMVGGGALSRELIAAHAAVRPIREVAVWTRRPAQAEEVAGWARAQGFDARAVGPAPEALAEAVGAADIVSCATLSTAPLVRGAWLRPGVHLDLVGAFRPDMRETDAEAVARAQVFVDTRAGAEGEAGDLLQARAEGGFDFADLRADLAELCAGRKPGRADAAAITLFKSVGAALEDHVAARLVLSELAR
ncbi:MAG: ornithine cyclodeaminase family protein [Rubrimonas sp.]|uniref:ornithine cyclodeaminase family protein n=1 Tax=Rubrimonas sp. TaxID=2036015 RepID=UPI002FDD0B43